MEFLTISENLSEFSKQLTLLQEYITLKFGQEFEEFCRRRRRQFESEERNVADFLNTNEYPDDDFTDTIREDGNSSRQADSSIDTTNSSTSTNATSTTSFSNSILLNPEVQIKTEDEFFADMDKSREDDDDDDVGGQDFNFGELEGMESFNCTAEALDCDIMEKKEEATGSRSKASKRQKMSSKISDSNTIKKTVRSKWTKGTTCDPETTRQRKGLLEAYVTNSKFRKSWEFPSLSNYMKMIEILKSKKGESVSHIQASLKTKMWKRFKLEVDDDGREVVVSISEGKTVLPQHEFLSVFEAFHDDSGHPGRDTTCKKMLATWHYVPDTLIREMLRQCSGCRIQRAKKNRNYGNTVLISQDVFQ